MPKPLDCHNRDPQGWARVGEVGAGEVMGVKLLLTALFECERCGRKEEVKFPAHFPSHGDFYLHPPDMPNGWATEVVEFHNCGLTNYTRREEITHCGCVRS